MTTPTRDSESLAEGKQVISAVAAIARTNNAGEPEILLAKRAADRKFLPDVFEIPGGHIDFGESLQDGLKREIREELSIDIKIGAIIGAFTYTNAIKKSHSVEIGYLAELISDEADITIDPHNHSELRWITEAEIPEVASPRGDDDPEYDLVRIAFDLLNQRPIPAERYARLEQLSGQHTA